MMLTPEVIARAKGVSFVIPFGFLREILSSLLLRPYHLAEGELGVRVNKKRIELLCRSFVIVHEGDAYAARRDRTRGLSYSLAFSPVPIGRPQVWRLLALSAWSDPPERPALQVLLGSGNETGLAAGLLSVGSHTLPLETIRIIGPGFRRIGTVDFPAGTDHEIAVAERTRWSRTIGALGVHAWRTLTLLKYCLIGVGRLGSLIACSLAKAGVRWIALVDPDRLEIHNLDAMDEVSTRDIGRLKVATVKAHLQRDSSHSEILALPHSLLTPEGLAAAREADVLISCADNDAPRLIAGAFASLHLKILLDIGTGIFDESSNQQLTIPNPRSPIRNRLMGLTYASSSRVKGVSSVLEEWPMRHGRSINSVEYNRNTDLGEQNGRAPCAA